MNSDDMNTDDMIRIGMELWNSDEAKEKRLKMVASEMIDVLNQMAIDNGEEPRYSMDMYDDASKGIILVTADINEPCTVEIAQALHEHDMPFIVCPPEGPNEDFFSIYRERVEREVKPFELRALPVPDDYFILPKRPGRRNRKKRNGQWGRDTFWK